MQHIEEHVLELYLLGDEKASERRQEIEVHLSECHGCRAMAHRIKSFYAAAEEELEKHPEAHVNPGQSLVHKRVEISPFYEADADPIIQRPVTRLQRFQYFVRRHPLAAGVGSFSFLAGLALLASTTLLSPRKDENPVYLQYILEQKSLQLYNASYEKLWSLPLASIDEAADYYDRQGAQLYDIDNDGRNELLTVLKLAGSDFGNRNTLQVFDFRGKLLFSKDFSQAFSYLRRDYSPDFGVRGVQAGAINANHQSGIVAIATNPHSPCYVALLNSSGKTTGEYWHFGYLYGCSFVDVDGDGKQEIVTWGENDAEDSTGGEFPAIVVLNPRKIVGKGKSLASPGFALPFSDAEMYYIRLPLTDLNKALHTHSHISVMRQQSDSTLWFTSIDGEFGGKFSFEFVFSPSMQPLQVKSTTWTNETHTALVEQGKLKGKLDNAYLQNLKDGIRYWNGKEWRKEVVPVNPTTVAVK